MYKKCNIELGFSLPYKRFATFMDKKEMKNDIRTTAWNTIISIRGCTLECENIDGKMARYVPTEKCKGFTLGQTSFELIHCGNPYIKLHIDECSDCDINSNWSGVPGPTHCKQCGTGILFNHRFDGYDGIEVISLDIPLDWLSTNMHDISFEDWITHIYTNDTSEVMDIAEESKYNP